MGEYNGGWVVLNRMLFHERTAISAGTAGEGLSAAEAFTRWWRSPVSGASTPTGAIRSLLAEF